MNANNLNRLLKQTMLTLNFDRGGCYSSHAFRMGATDELKNGDSTLAAILKSGTWLSASYLQYLDLQADEAIKISALLLAGLSSDSEDSDPPPS